MNLHRRHTAQLEHRRGQEPAQPCNLDRVVLHALQPLLILGVLRARDHQPAFQQLVIRSPVHHRLVDRPVLLSQRLEQRVVRRNAFDQDVKDHLLIAIERRDPPGREHRRPRGRGPLDFHNLDPVLVEPNVGGQVLEPVRQLRERRLPLAKPKLAVIRDRARPVLVPPPALDHDHRVHHAGRIRETAQTLAHQGRRVRQKIRILLQRKPQALDLKCERRLQLEAVHVQLDPARQIAHQTVRIREQPVRRERHRAVHARDSQRQPRVRAPHALVRLDRQIHLAVA